MDDARVFDFSSFQFDCAVLASPNENVSVDPLLEIDFSGPEWDELLLQTTDVSGSQESSSYQNSIGQETQTHMETAQVCAETTFSGEQLSLCPELYQLDEYTGYFIPRNVPDDDFSGPEWEELLLQATDVVVQKENNESRDPLKHVSGRHVEIVQEFAKIPNSFFEMHFEQISMKFIEEGIPVLSKSCARKLWKKIRSDLGITRTVTTINAGHWSIIRKMASSEQPPRVRFREASKLILKAGLSPLKESTFSHALTCFKADSHCSKSRYRLYFDRHKEILSDIIFFECNKQKNIKELYQIAKARFEQEKMEPIKFGTFATWCSRLKRGWRLFGKPPKWPKLSNISREILKEIFDKNPEITPDLALLQLTKRRNLKAPISGKSVAKLLETFRKQHELKPT